MRTKAELDLFSPREAISGDRPFFMVGIGGAGMSALALLLRQKGRSVRGTDATESPTTEELVLAGVPVHIGHTGEGIEPQDQVVVSDAIPLDHSPEVRRARELGCPVFRRSQLLGWLLHDRRTVAVAGTHGKTTTTGMVGAALVAAGAEPLVVVGAAIPEWNGPVRYGSGEWAVAEACEAYDSLHDLDPEIVVLTNLEPDHLDYHGDFASLVDSVCRFLSKPSVSCIVLPEGDPAALDAARRSGKRVVVVREGDFPRALRSPGRHNRINASLARAALREIGVEGEAAEAAIAEFGGAERRLQVLYEGSAAIVDDYAHHPTEISASIQALRERFPGRRILVVFQPHLYSRTAQFLADFSKSLSQADHVVLTDIYPAREDPMPGMSSARIAEGLTVPHQYVPQRHLLPRVVASVVRDGDVVVGMGAGNIAEFAPAMAGELERASRIRRALAGERVPLRVAVVYGGDSTEREVSIHSGRAVFDALQRLGHDPFLIDVSERLLSGKPLADMAGGGRPDVAFLAVHGTHSEDGALQGLLELLHIPYTGSGVLASAIGMNKQMTKELLASHRLPVPRGQLVFGPDDPIEFDPPCIVKPNAQGSTVGVTFLKTSEGLREAVSRATIYGGGAIVEEWIEGMEISVPVLGDRALPPVEIAPASGQYDFASKYTPGATEEIVPARLSPPMLERVQEQALAAHRTIGCSGATRTDMIVRGGEAVILEINTLPGMTPTSLLPNSARAVGIEFDDLVQWIVIEALRRWVTA
ncbi:MAG: D-alanine--D-alanine ligase [Fimbriimonadaceae bacterium]